MRKIKSFKSFIYIIFSILLIPNVLAAHSVANDLNSFFTGFKALFSGNVVGFVNGVIGAIPLFGLIVIIYALTNYASIVTIFKKKEYHKFGKMFGIGLALVGLAQQNIYDFILGTSATLITVLFLLLVVFMIIIYWNTLRTNQMDSSKEKLDSEKEVVKSEHALNEEKKKLTALEHEISKDKHLFGRVNDELDSLDRSLKHYYKLTGDELSQVEEIIKLVMKASNSTADVDKSKMHDLVKNLLRHIAGLIDTMKHDSVDEVKVKNLLSKIETDLEYIKHGSKHALKDEEILKKYVAKYGITTDDTKALTVINNMSNIKNLIVTVRNATLELIAIEAKLKSHESELNACNYVAKHNQADKARADIHSYEFKDAHKNLDILREMILRGRSITNEIIDIEKSMNIKLSEINSAEHHLYGLLGSIKPHL